MSVIDFSQDASDNASLYIAVLPLGEVTAALYSSVLDTLNLLSAYRSPDGKNNYLHFKFISTVPKWGQGGSEWSQFTVYKQVVGVLAVSQCFDEEDALLIESEFRKLTAKYKQTLCDSKCIVFGDKKSIEEQLDFRRGFCAVDADLTSNSGSVGIGSKDITTVLRDFFLVIHGVLTSRLKDMSKALGPTNKDIPVLVSPFERLTDNHDKYYPKKHCLARVRKQIADMYLVSGSVQEAVSQYSSVIEMLRSYNDWLWLGSAYEGLACAALIMKSNEPLSQLDFSNGINWKHSPRNSQRLTTRSRPGSPKQRGIISKTSSDYSISRSSPKSVRKTYSHGGNKEVADFGESTIIEQPVNVEDKELEEFGQSDHIDEVEEDEIDGKLLQRLLQKDYIVDKFTRALHYYGKAGPVGGVSHIEGLLKFSKFLVSEKRYILACETLHRVFKVESYVSEDDKVLLYKTISAIYASMGFKRKASMMTHYAALQSFRLCDDSHPQTLYQAYELLKECLPGFSLSLDVDNDDSDSDTNHLQLLPKGWPVVQAKVLKDLVLLTKYMNQNASAIRLMCVLLQSLYMHLSSAELEEITSLLEQSATQSQENENFVPFLTQKKINRPIPLTEIPKVRYFKPCKLSDHLHPHRYPGYVQKTVEKDSGPFIYSSLRINQRKKPKEVFWVEGTAVEVSVTIMNPLPFDIKVEKMCILSEGVTMESVPFGLVLSPDHEPHQFTLISIPRATGQLTLLGYSAVVFSVKSECIVRVTDHPLIHVVPSLPLVRVRLLGPSCVKAPVLENGSIASKQRNSIVSIIESNNMLELMDGESSSLDVVIDNTGEQPVTAIKIKLQNRNSEFCAFSFDEAEVQRALPLAVGSHVKMRVQVSANVPSHLKTVSEEREMDFPDSGSNFFPGLIQPIADSPGPGDSPATPNKSNYQERTKSLPAVAKKLKTSKGPFGTFTLRIGTLSRDSSASGIQETKGKGKKRALDEIDADRLSTASGKVSLRRPTSPMSSVYERPSSVISNSSYTESVTLDSESISQPLLTHKTASVEFEVEYTGGPGANVGYYRKTQLCVTATILPAFHFSHFDVFPHGEATSKFTLKFNVTNATSNPLELSCAVHQSLVDGSLSDTPTQTECWNIDGSSNRRVEVVLKKFALTELEEASEQEELEQYQHHLANLVRLTWTSTLLGKQSRNSISAFAIPADMLSIMKHIPLHFDVLLNDNSPSVHATTKLPVNSKVDITITLKSIHSSSLANLLLLIQPHQEDCTGSPDNNLTGKMVHSGSLRVLIPRLNPSESHQHKIMMTFLCKGIYRIGIKCTQLVTGETIATQPSTDMRSSRDSSSHLLHLNNESKRNSLRICVSPVLPSSTTLRSRRSPMPSMSPTPVYDRQDSPHSFPHVNRLHETISGPLLTLDVYQPVNM